MVFRNIDRRMPLNATGPARFVSTAFRLPSPCRFCYKLFSRGWVILLKYWVSARFPLLSWRAATSGSDATKSVVQTLTRLEICVGAADVSYFRETDALASQGAPGATVSDARRGARGCGLDPPRAPRALQVRHAFDARGGARGGAVSVRLTAAGSGVPDNRGGAGCVATIRLTFGGRGRRISASTLGRGPGRGAVGL